MHHASALMLELRELTSIGVSRRPRQLLLSLGAACSSRRYLCFYAMNALAARLAWLPCAANMSLNERFGVPRRFSKILMHDSAK